jgi:ribosome biogenesis protein UTP30
LKHIKATEKASTESRPNLLAGGKEEEDESIAIWFQLTTKKHITDTKRLKPGKIAVPHPLNSSTTTTICLITADPQRTYKDIVTSPAFPSALSSRITKVVGIAKLKAKWTQYEAQRKLYSEHDIFLADDRIITQLPKLLGKTFYQKTTKRPVPVNLQPPAPRTDGKRIARAKGTAPQAASPQQIATEIEKAIQGTLVHLTPSTNTSVKVGYASWDPKKLAANIEAVAATMIEKYVPKKWRGVKSMHIKGPTTAALPIWLTDELWVDEADVLDEETAKQINAANVGKKRKAVESAEEEGKGKKSSRLDDEGKKDTSKKQKLLKSNDDKLDKEIELRRERLKKQKEEAALAIEDEVPKASKKSKKSKA